jgi:hypothetical protein
MDVIMACALSLVLPFLVCCADEAWGSCENVVLWRGHFNATGAEKSVNLSINGGQGSCSAATLMPMAYQPLKPSLLVCG